MTEITEQDCRAAFDRVARGAAGVEDGRLIYLWLQKELMGIPATEKSGALRHHTGRRSLAAQLMAMMAEGIETSAGPGKSAADRPVVFKLAEPRRVADARAERARARRGPSEPDAGE